MYITTFGLWLIAIFVVVIVYKLYSLDIQLHELKECHDKMATTYADTLTNHAECINEIRDAVNSNIISIKKLKETVDNDK